MVVRPNVLNVDELLRLFRAKRGVRVLDYEIDLIIRLLQPRALMTYESLPNRFVQSGSQIVWPPLSARISFTVIPIGMLVCTDGSRWYDYAVTPDYLLLAVARPGAVTDPYHALWRPIEA